MNENMVKMKQKININLVNNHGLFLLNVMCFKCNDSIFRLRKKKILCSSTMAIISSNVNVLHTSIELQSFFISNYKDPKRLLYPIDKKLTSNLRIQLGSFQKYRSQQDTLKKHQVKKTEVVTLQSDKNTLGQEQIEIRQ